ncbi:hypothetical protein F7725_006509 [Dissostichus mawsoni]|uniref:Uncharacterized protein n=1 Tax=Dissostichus mawsoni TaxID=36200 RepID=A0A7J5XVR9_DISMA|nr:hypothetical protein F7725_006509 [Dissostichus mawsoni]
MAEDPAVELASDAVELHDVGRILVHPEPLELLHQSSQSPGVFSPQIRSDVEKDDGAVGMMELEGRDGAVGMELGGAVGKGWSCRGGAVGKGWSCRDGAVGMELEMELPRSAAGWPEERCPAWGERRGTRPINIHTLSVILRDFQSQSEL